MKHYTSWVLLILPIVIALPENQTPLEKAHLMVSDIYTGNYTSAKIRFLEMDDPAVTRTIVDIMASKPNYENYLKFIKELPSLEHRMTGYEAMLEKNNLGFSIFTLDYDFLELLANTTDTNVTEANQPTIDNVRKYVKDHLRKELAALAIKIATKTPAAYKDLVQYADSHLKAFDAHLEDLVEKVYEYTGNDVDVLEKILGFSDALLKIYQAARTYIKTFDLMTKNQDTAFAPTVKIAFKVKRLMNMVNFKNIAEIHKVSMRELKEKFPATVKTLIWGHVCIKNVELGAYLDSKGVYENNRRNVILGPGSKNWEIQAIDNGDAFRMIHVPTVECFYAESDELAYGPTKRRLFTSQKNCDKLINPYWLLEDAKWQEGEFFIKNKNRNEYLCGEEVKEEAPAGGDITDELEGISEKNPALADKIKLWLAVSGKTDRLQAFTWRRRSRCQNPTWKLIDSSKC